MGKSYYRKTKTSLNYAKLTFNLSIIVGIGLAFIYDPGLIFLPVVLALLAYSAEYVINSWNEGAKKSSIRIKEEADLRLKEQQEVKRLQAQQEAERSYKDFIRRVSEVYVSNNREEYVIKKEDYKRGNNRENEYRKKYLLPLLSLYNNKCAKCGKMDNGFDLDHFFLSKNEGGNFSLLHKDGYLVNNAIPLCQSCNRSKGDRPYNHFFDKEEVITLFTKNKEMTLLLNRAFVDK